MSLSRVGYTRIGKVRALIRRMRLHLPLIAFTPQINISGLGEKLFLSNFRRHEALTLLN